MDSLYIVIPAYNEQANLKELIDEWYNIVRAHDGNGESRMVVIDDGSKDSTYSVLMELAKDRPLLIPLTKPNSGHGPTVLYGYHYALEHHADYVFQTDSDRQTDPGEFEKFWNLRKDYSAIIGERAIRGDGKLRKYVENTVCMLLYLFYGVKVKDANAPYRLMDAELLSKYLSKIPSDYNLPNIILTAFFAYYNEQIKFVEITFKPRQGGKNSINIRKICKIGWNALGDFYKFKVKMKDGNLS